MNEELPSQLPPPPPEPPLTPQRPSRPDSSSFFVGMIALGFGLLVLSCLACAGAGSILPFSLAAVGAFVSLFFTGYRGIFIGFVGIIAIIALAVVVLCGTGVIPAFHE
jgi:hypothetical protein